ncbi:MAG: EAL domain-containing protein [Gammaproteobacteria bacterium]|nr:EAL domain-containing protein [Gammaproteobacteria bacterium]
MNRRKRILVAAALLAIGGTLALIGATAWISWREAFEEENTQITELARGIAERTERIVLEARNTLLALDELEVERCSAAHFAEMEAAAMQHPWIKSIGHWRADERLCATGLAQGTALKPPQADRIYPSGLIAWWPSRHTSVAGVELFLMRFGNHDIAMDPRFFVDAGLTGQQAAGLWLENLMLTSNPPDAVLPPLDAIPPGVRLDQAEERIESRFSLGRMLPIDVVVVEPADGFWHRQNSLIRTAAAVGGGLSLLWLLGIVILLRYQLSLRSELRDAISRGDITAWYQPIVDLATGECVGAEALARLMREDGSLINPDMFLPVAESEGLMPDVTLAVMDSLLADLPALLKLNPGLKINLNLSSDDLQDPGFGQQLALRLATAKVPSHAIKLEITERALINDEAARAHIRDFRARGHKVAIDDFGTGYSSLSYLETFEIDTLKIDKTFVDAIGAEAVTSHVISHIIDMAKSLKLDIVAEGIEQQAQAEWLERQGVHQGQGYLYSKPLTARAFRRYLRGRPNQTMA